VSYNKNTQSSPERVLLQSQSCPSPVNDTTVQPYSYLLPTRDLSIDRPDLSPNKKASVRHLSCLSPTKEDPILESSFSFNVPKASQKAAPGSSAILDLGNWLSESDEDSISNIIVASQNTKQAISAEFLEKESANQEHQDRSSISSGLPSRTPTTNTSPWRYYRQNQNESFLAPISQQLCQKSPLANSILESLETNEKHQKEVPASQIQPQEVNKSYKRSSQLRTQEGSKISKPSAQLDENKSLKPKAQSRNKRKQTNSLYTELSDPISESSSPLKTNKKSAGVPKQAEFTYTPKDLKEANKVTRKKEELMSEMILKVSHRLYSDLEESRLKSIFMESTVESFPSQIPMIFWKRKVLARYNPDTDTFVPCPVLYIHEKTVVLYYKAEEFIEKAQTGSLKTDCEFSLSLLRRADEKIQYKVIIIVEGYDQLVLKLKNIENLKYKNEVLKRLNPNETIRTTKTKCGVFGTTLREVEYLFNKTQLEIGVNIFPVRTPVEGINWLYSFTYTIAFSLYDKFERNHSLANLGTVRSGTDTKSTFVQTLRQFKLMTEPKAEKLFGQYSSLFAIYTELQSKGTLGKDGSGKNFVPPSADNAMKKTFLAENADGLINE
jgi:crossover junction endonuclease EME1